MVNGVIGVRFPSNPDARSGLKPPMQNSNINSNAERTKPEKIF